MGGSRARRIAAVAVALALAVSAGCSDSDDEPDGAGTTSTTAGDTTTTGDDGEEGEGEQEGADETTTTNAAPDSEDEGDNDGDESADADSEGDEADPEPDEGDEADESEPDEADDSDGGEVDETTTTGPLPDDAVVSEAPIGNEPDDDSTLTMAESDGAINRFAVQDLVVDCFPLEGGAEQQTRTVDVSIEDVPVDDDGMVDHNDPDAPYSPVLSGLFNDDGEFIGSLELRSEQDGYLCGGEFTFAAGG